MIKTAVYLSC